MKKFAERVLNLWRAIGSFGLVQALSFFFQWARGETLIRIQVPGIHHPLFFRHNGSDRAVLWQVFSLRGCAVEGLKEPPRFILDGGANVGYSAVFYANAYPNASILAIEPDAENCELLRQNCRPYPNIKLLQGAIWPASSALAIKDPHSLKWALQTREAQAGEAATIPGFTIAELLAQSGFERIDLLKLDIEGAEAAVFAQEELPWLARVNALVIEPHGNEIQQLISNRMRVHGFQEEKTDDEKWIYRKG